VRVCMYVCMYAHNTSIGEEGAGLLESDIGICVCMYTSMTHLISTIWSVI
jgi:hypothetical protein